MFNKRNDNSIKDNEVDDFQKKSFFKKRKTDSQIAIDNYDKSSSGIDYNKEYLNNNSVSNKKILKTISIFVIFILLVIILVPRLLHYNNDSKKDYVDIVNHMVDKVIVYYTDDTNKCTSSYKDRYYFNINNSREIFGDYAKSPFLRNNLQGYVEFDMKEDNSYDVYVSFTDGMFGFDRVKYNELGEDDIKLFTYLNIDHSIEMVCNKQFDISK